VQNIGEQTSMKTVAIFALLSLSAGAAHPATIYVPSALSNTEGTANDTSPLGLDVEVRLQQVYGSSLLGGLNIGDKITGITFRIDGNNTSGVPAQTVPVYELRLSQSVNAPGSMNMTFAANRGADEVIVRSGPLVIGANDFPATAAAGPEPWGVFIGFTTPYTYNGGNLLLELAYMGFQSGRHTDDQFNFDGQQIFTGQNIGGFSKLSADYTETGVFATAFEINGDGQNVPEPSTILLAATGIGLCVCSRRRRR
jgi:hypothetical protein